MLTEVREALRALADQADSETLQRFFKTGPGDYGEGDRFIGVRVPAIRRVARQYRGLSQADTLSLLRSGIHEERLLALIILKDMPRTMLRYAIEKFPEDHRQQYLKGSISR